ncbi:MAG: AAA family ATPase [bacterium]
MYLDHYGLVTDPFSLTPRLDFLYSSGAYEESFAHLAYALENGEALTLITGPIGIGKTLVVHSFLSYLGPNYVPALVNTTQVGYKELLKLILSELGVGVPPGADRADFLTALKMEAKSRREKGQTLLIVIDEAQDLSIATLEGVRLLTNLDQVAGQAVQVVLVGQPDLERKLMVPELTQLRQRIRVHYRLEPLTPNELGEYIEHRMTVAGCERTIFKQDALDRIFEYSHGIPRLVNTLAGEALLSAYVDGLREVRAKHVEKNALLADAEAASALLPGSTESSAERLVEEVLTAARGHILSPHRQQETSSAQLVAPTRTSTAVPRKRRRTSTVRLGSVNWRRVHWRTVILAFVAMFVIILAVGYFRGWLPLGAVLDNLSPSGAFRAESVQEADQTRSRGAGSDAGSPTGDDTRSSRNLAGLNGAEVDRDHPAGTQPVSQPQVGTSNLADPPARETASPAVPDATLGDEEGFAVHVSSFREIESVEEVIAEIHTLGVYAFHREITIRGRIWHRVFIGPFRDTDDARDAIAYLRANEWNSYFRIMRMRDVH